MAHKKAGGSSRNGRDSAGRRLGVKKFGGQEVIGGHIIVRQSGTRVYPGINVGMGKDHTLFTTADGQVRFHDAKPGRKYVSVDMMTEALTSGRSIIILPQRLTHNGPSTPTWNN